jgi:two-component system sensor histidine kinase KdpD
MTSRAAAERRIFPWAAIPAAVALVTFAGRAGGANAATIGFFYLAAVLGLATWGGWAVGAVASVAAMLCFNFFFLPPFGTLTIAEPSNWVALLAFLGASTLASRLVATARREAAEAERRRREVEILYELCFGLFTVSPRPGALGEAAGRTLRAIGAEAGALWLAGENAPASVIGPPLDADPGVLARVLESRETIEDGGEGERRTAYIPLAVGERVGGVLAARGALASRAVLEPAGRLLALAIERDRLLEEAAHLEAVRESDALKTGLLRAVSHDLRTPLTAMRLEIESLDRQLQDQPAPLASVRGLSLAQERLARRIDNLLSLARLEAGVARPRPEPVPPGELFRTARESLALILAGRPVEVRIAPGCPDLWADPSLTLEALVNLLENAAHAAPPGSPIELAASPDPEDAKRVWIEVRDEGPGMPEIGERGDGAPGGLGLQIVRGLAEASGGALSLLGRAAEGKRGTVARIALPAAPEPEDLAA